jgi:hypothetical protein
MVSSTIPLRISQRRTPVVCGRPPLPRRQRRLGLGTAARFLASAATCGVSPAGRLPSALLALVDQHLDAVIGALEEVGFVDLRPTHLVIHDDQDERSSPPPD